MKIICEWLNHQLTARLFLLIVRAISFQLLLYPFLCRLYQQRLPKLMVFYFQFAGFQRKAICIFWSRIFSVSFAFLITDNLFLLFSKLCFQWWVVQCVCTFMQIWQLPSQISVERCEFAYLSTTFRNWWTQLLIHLSCTMQGEYRSEGSYRLIQDTILLLNELLLQMFNSFRGTLLVCLNWDRVITSKQTKQSFLLFSSCASFVFIVKIKNNR